MQDVMTRLVDVPMARMFVLGGIIFLLIAVLGRVEGKIEPGNMGRIGAGIIGLILVVAGLAMHYIETDALRNGLRERSLSNLAAPAPAPVATAAPSAESAAKLPEPSPAPTADKPAIKVVSGTYGRNCGGKAGNATAALAKACDGRNACEYRPDPAELADPAPNCSKDYAAEWKCGTAATVYSATLGAGAPKDEQLRLACGG